MLIVKSARREIFLYIKKDMSGKKGMYGSPGVGPYDS